MPRRYLPWLLLAVAVLPFFVNLGATSIIDANEAFYTETPREMLESGTLLNSTFNYQPRFNKPPLSYWAVLGTYHVFGVSLWSARLPIALGALVMLAAAYVLGRTAFSPRAGWIAALTLAVTPRFLLFARRILIDIWSAMFLGVALACFALAESDPARRRRWLLAMYVATGLGVLTKGPIAVAIPLMVFPLYLWATGRLGRWREYRLLTGALIVVAIVAPYYIGLYVEFGWDHITTFLLRENLARYADGVGAPYRGPLFYLPVVFADLYFPWSLLLPVALALVPWRRLARWRAHVAVAEPAARSGAASSGEIRLLLGLWIVVIVGFFSASRAQQDLYVLPFLPAGAALVGGLLARTASDDVGARLAWWMRAGTALMIGVLAAVGAGAVIVLGFVDGPLRLAGGPAAGAALVVCAAGAGVALWRRRLVQTFGWTLAGLLVVAWVTVTLALPDFERYKPVPRLATVIESQPRRADAVASYKVAIPSLVFYLRRHVHQLFDEQQLTDFLSGEGTRYCIMRDDEYETVKKSLPVGTRVVASSPRFETRVWEIFAHDTPQPSMVLIAPEPHTSDSASPVSR